MSNKLTIASIGMNEKHTFFFQQLLKIYAPQLKHQWSYIGNFDATHVIETMGSSVENVDALLIDIDDEYGKRAWYILQVFMDENKMIALSSQQKHLGICHILQKPSLNWSVREGEAIVIILNNIAIK